MRIRLYGSDAIEVIVLIIVAILLFAAMKTARDCINNEKEKRKTGMQINDLETLILIEALKCYINQKTIDYVKGMSEEERERILRSDNIKNNLFTEEKELLEKLKEGLYA